MAAAAMDAMAERYADRGVSSVFVYTREAHPAEHYGAHTSFEDKIHHAEALRDELGVSRPILLDAVDGPCHRAWGMLPNMSFIVAKRGTLAYKADWTSADDVEDALKVLLDAPERFDTGRVPFYAERLSFRGVDREGFMKGLERNGPKAVTDFQN